jgi:double-stranded uracil-DNA glycosylase
VTTIEDDLRTLPDLLRPGLDVVFAGINPGAASARAGHYYAQPGNGFWRALSASGLVTAPCTYLDDASLLEAGIGFTDVSKRVETNSMKLSDQELREAEPAFRARIASASPRVVCFTGARQFDVLFPGVRGAHAWGPQPATIEGATVWVMPSTSGRAAAFRAEGARVLRELALALGRTRPGKVEVAP